MTVKATLKWAALTTTYRKALPKHKAVQRTTMKTKARATVNSTFLTAQSTPVIASIIRNTATVCKSGLTVPSTRDTGRMTKPMELEH